MAFSGISVTENGKPWHLDPYLAYQRACLHAIDYLTNFGSSKERAYLLLRAAPIEGRLSSVVDIPNACATLYLPTAIFDFDIKPSVDGPQRIDPGPRVLRAPQGDLPEADALRAVSKKKRALLPAAGDLAVAWHASASKLMRNFTGGNHR